jgi:hypothetical protein
MKQEVQGSSAGGRQTCVFRAKNRMTSDLGRVTMWLSSVVSPDIKKNPYFLAHFLDFLETTSLSIF